MPPSKGIPIMTMIQTNLFASFLKLLLTVSIKAQSVIASGRNRKNKISNDRNPIKSKGKVTIMLLFSALKNII
jgi:hypothetical protein